MFNSEQILEGLPELEQLFENSSDRVYKKGQVVFRQGKEPDGIFFIREGKVKKYKVDKDGVAQIVYIAKPGELIGYHALLAEEVYPDSASALHFSRIAFISKETFFSVLNRSQTLSRRLLKTLGHEFSVLVNSLTLASRRSVRERVAIQLLLLREKYKENFVPGMEVDIDISRDDLADLVGTARENVLRVLRAFKDEKILSTKGRRIIVKDVKKLLKVSNY